MLTLQFVPYSEIEHLNSDKRVQKLLEIAKENKIVMLEGRLKKHEETDLIKKTMEEISSSFKGVEIAVVYPEKEAGAVFEKLKKQFISALLGDRLGFTIIGPATVVKEIKKDPNKILLFTKEVKSAKKKRN